MPVTVYQKEATFGIVFCWRRLRVLLLPPSDLWSPPRRCSCLFYSLLDWVQQESTVTREDRESLVFQNGEISLKRFQLWLRDFFYSSFFGWSLEYKKRRDKSRIDSSSSSCLKVLCVSSLLFGVKVSGRKRLKAVGDYETKWGGSWKKQVRRSRSWWWWQGMRNWVRWSRSPCYVLLLLLLLRMACVAFLADEGMNE